MLEIPPNSCLNKVGANLQCLSQALNDFLVWKECPYETRDGLFNPDGRLINDVGAFSDLADAVLYNSISHTFQDQPTSIYSQNVVNFLKVWFLNKNTRMNPNLNYAQMNRGPDGQFGDHTGIL